MKNKGFYIILFVIILGFISIYLFSLVDIQLQESAQKAEIQNYNLYRILGVILLIILGILVEYKRVVSIFQNGIKLDTFPLVATVVLFVLLILPYNITAQLGIPYPSSIKGTLSFIINTTSTRNILSLLTGILLVKSFSNFVAKKEIS